MYVRISLRSRRSKIKALIVVRNLYVVYTRQNAILQREKKKEILKYGEADINSNCLPLRWHDMIGANNTKVKTKNKAETDGFLFI